MGKDVHVAVIADPQLTDAYSYRMNPGWKLSAVEFYSDIFMKRNFKLLNWQFEPDYIIILGDLMDGGREWIRGGVREGMFPKELSRFNHIFRNSGVKAPIYPIAGNHDIGIGTNILPEAYARFKKEFGKVNYSFKVGGHNIIALDTLSYLGSAESPYFQKSDAFVRNFLENDDGTSPRILLTHVPLYRPDDADCGPIRNKPPIRQGYGYQYQNLLNEPLTQYLFTRIRPTLVLSGDDHDFCHHEHTGAYVAGSGAFAVPEHSVASFSWLMGNVYPGFALLSLNGDVKGVGDGSGWRMQTCALVPQLVVYRWYIWLLVISVVGTFLWVGVTRESWEGRVAGGAGMVVPGVGTKEKKKAGPVVAAGRLSWFGFAVWTVVYGLGMFLEVILSTVAVYAVLLLYDWL
ncbi:Metallo-dependent phosphatase-like protein [Chytriomyces sp. MP71]|nr:Metallo-dependent phosphatase-like protein [Chytriomyces sp. MP71]